VSQNNSFFLLSCSVTALRKVTNAVAEETWGRGYDEKDPDPSLGLCDRRQGSEGTVSENDRSSQSVPRRPTHGQKEAQELPRR
jgi:hypothetical protein